MSVREARAGFSDLLGSVYYTKEAVVVEKKGKPVAVVISPDEYERFQEQTIERGWRAIEALQARNADEDPDEVFDIVTAVVEEVRQERYGQQ